MPLGKKIITSSNNQCVKNTMGKIKLYFTIHIDYLGFFTPGNHPQPPLNVPKAPNRPQSGHLSCPSSVAPVLQFL